MFTYPFTGFHFKVTFEILAQATDDTRFQEVTGLTSDVSLDTYNEGGENRFSHRLPGRASYTDLVLKRGMSAATGLTAWCQDGIVNFNYQPTNILITLLNEQHLPAASWYVINAIPIKYDISGLNAEQSQIMIESMTLRYEYYKILDLPASPVSSSALDSAISAIAGVAISVP